MRLFSSMFGHRRLAVFFSLAGVFLMSSSCTFIQVGHRGGGSKTFTVAGNGTTLNTFRVPLGFNQLNIEVWGAAGGGGGGHASLAHKDNFGYGGGGGASGACPAKQFTIVSGTATSPFTVAENTLLTINVGSGGSGGAGQTTGNVNSGAAASGGNGTTTSVLATGTLNPTLISASGANAGDGGSNTLPGANGGQYAGACSYPGSNTSGIGGGGGATSISGTSAFVFGSGGSGGTDPGCNNEGNNGSGGTAPGGGGGGGSGGRTCGAFGGRHSGGSGGNGANGQVRISWQ
jgi:hypothetical protein